MFPSSKPLLNEASFVHEIKWDGYRALVYLGHDVEIRSRNGHLLNSKFPELIAALRSFSNRTMVLDGEVVAFNEEGIPDFSLLQRGTGKIRGELVYVVFDLLYLDGDILCQRPWKQRRMYLNELTAESKRLTLSPVFSQTQQEVLKAVNDLGLEGVVSKCEHSPYLPGEHSLYWRKLKRTRTADCVVVGYLESGNSVRSLCLAQYRDDGELLYIGKVGSGLGETEIAFIKEASSLLMTSNCPVMNPPSNRYCITWLQPKIVVEVQYLELTPQFRLRHAVFHRFRWDKLPSQCVLGGE